MTDFQSSQPPWASGEATLDAFPAPVPYRSISWEFETRVYLADDDEDIPRWWKEEYDDSEGYESLPEELSFEEVLDACEPRYWPVLCAWMLEDLVSEGWDSHDRRWRELLQSKPDAQQQLKEILVAVMPPGAPDELRAARRLSREAAIANLSRATQRFLQIGEYECEPGLDQERTSPLDPL